MGIADDEKENIFGSFEQIDTGIKTAGGTGLGLAISRHMARLMGGDITVQSTVEKGSVFDFTFGFELGIESDVE